MSSILEKISRLLFGFIDWQFYKDFRFWLLLIVINCGANLGFNYYFEQQVVKVVLFVICIYLMLEKYRVKLDRNSGLYIFLLGFILLFQSVYLDKYSFTTSIHYLLMISIAVMVVFICGDRFVRYFSGIIFGYACISLLCFGLQNFGFSIPYVAIADTTIDDGIIMRVSSLYYTQLGNPDVGLSYNFRNCGPFWEPGAFQGFLNISLFFELTMHQLRDRIWKLRVIILVITIITTLSTGGYIVLFIILGYYFSNDSSLPMFAKVFLTILTISIFFYLYNTLDFLGNKVSSDEGRLTFSFVDFPNLMYMLFGYGYSPESFKASSITSASSVFNLLRYTGISGFCVYMTYLLKNRIANRFIYFIIVSLILTNEPFLSNAMIWWGMAFVSYKRYNKDELTCVSL